MGIMNTENMIDYRDIFYGRGPVKKKPNAVKRVNVDLFKHGNRLVRIAKSLEPNLVLNGKFEDTFYLFLEYFTGMYDANKGIWISGPVGSGKTLLFRIFHIYTSEILRINSFLHLSYKEMTDLITAKGNSEMNTYQNSPVLIDDLGAGLIDVNMFGNPVNMIDVMIDYRYRAFTDNRCLTHISTNLYPSEFRSLTDQRTYSRDARDVCDNRTDRRRF
jgi:hypothetical protein